MKNAIIQINFTSGMGDFILALHEVVYTAKSLRDDGYYLRLYLFLSNNVYMREEDFFNFFNKEIFEDFSEIIINKIPIKEKCFEDLKHVYTLCGASPGQHWWDLFLSSEEDIYNFLKLGGYTQKNIFEKRLPFLNNSLFDEYKKMKRELNLLSYNSIHYRTRDCQFDKKIFEKNKPKILDVLNTNVNFYFATNSQNIKKWLRDINFRNVTNLNFEDDEKDGVHYDYNKLLFSNIEKLNNTTKLTLFEIMLIGDSNKFYLFSEWERPSNFSFLAKVKNIEMIENF
jgi:hypothetical protein